MKLLASLIVGFALLYGGYASAQSRDAGDVQQSCKREASRMGWRVQRVGFPQYAAGRWELYLQAQRPQGSALLFCQHNPRNGHTDISTSGSQWDGGWWGGQDGYAATVVCQSKDNRYRECELPFSGRIGVQKQYSDTRCIYRRNWGLKRGSVWVNEGCRARFIIEYGGANGGWNPWPGGGFYPPGGNDGYYPGPGGGIRPPPPPQNGPVIAERACMNRAQEMGYRVYRQDAARPAGGGAFVVNLGLTKNGRQTNARCTYRNGRAYMELLTPTPRDDTSPAGPPPRPMPTPQGPKPKPSVQPPGPTPR